MSFQGTVVNGGIVTNGPVPFPEGTVVEIIPATVPPTKPDEPSENTTIGSRLLERLKPLMVEASELPEDLSSQIDHYLYGVPKK